MNKTKINIATLNKNAETAALQRQSALTKPPGALGRLEDIAVRLAAMQAKEKPSLDNIWISVFAADHGIAQEGVSAFPQAVTAEMIKNFARGGAAINVLARQLQAKLEVINLGTVTPVSLDNVRSEVIAAGTRNFAHEAAMSESQFEQAIQTGRSAVQRALHNQAQLFIGGEMGIANTTSATAIACILLDQQPVQLAGPGTGLNPEGISRKVEIINNAINRYRHLLKSPLDCLKFFGGFEIAALTGAYLQCAQQGLAVLIDGFISTAAALLAENIQPGSKNWFFFSHNSAEPGHAKMLAALDAKPLLDLGMRLGEGSGAATAVPLLRLACALHNEMATFAEASVSEKSC